MRKLMLLLLAMLPLALCAQTRKVSGTYTYYADPSMSVRQAMAAAIEYAKVQALAKEFGTTVVQNTTQQESMKNGEENNFFMQQNSSEVKGEWLEDTSKPEAKIVATMQDGVLVIEAKVSGRARAISNEMVDFQAATLRNGMEKRFADTEFIAGDDLYLYFKSPTDGYVAVYLVDENANAYCLLPYPNDPDGQQPVKHGKEYVFFSNQHPYDLPANVVERMYITCDDVNVENDQVYVIFSPNPFVKAVDDNLQRDNRILPPQLTFSEFSKWLGKMGARDKKMGKKIIRITARKK